MMRMAPQVHISEHNVHLLAGLVCTYIYIYGYTHPIIKSTTIDYGFVGLGQASIFSNQTILTKNKQMFEHYLVQKLTQINKDGVLYNIQSSYLYSESYAFIRVENHIKYCFSSSPIILL